MRTQNQKLKLLYLMDILKSETDEQHPMTVEAMIKKLEEQEISAERKALYRDLDALETYGLDIIRQKNKGSFIGSRLFSLPELRLLADAVASSKFMTLKKSESLIKKLQTLTSRHQAQALNRQIYYLDRVKSDNEQIYYNIDALHQAIADQKQVSFIYQEYGTDKRLHDRRGGERYQVSPYLLLWDDQHYYMIAYYSRYQGLSHFRVDKMRAIINLDEPVIEIGKPIDPAGYARQVFSMFGGQETEVELAFEPKLMGVMIDRFGRDIMIFKSGEWMKTTVKVNISVSFYGWLFQLGRRIKITAPERTAEDFSRYLEEVAVQYD